jgi:hypothetical protein
MAATLRYGRERAYLGRSLLNFMRIARDAHAPPRVAFGTDGKPQQRRDASIAEPAARSPSPVSLRRGCGQPKVARGI